jgi:hypothetical protein
MAIHPKLPRSPYAELDPEHRWFPAAEELREKSYEKFLPPLVAQCARRSVSGVIRGIQGPLTLRALCCFEGV